MAVSSVTGVPKITTFDEVLNHDKPFEVFDAFNKINRTIDQDNDILRRFKGSLVGLAVGDALGASVEFRPHDYMQQNPVKDMCGGGTWGLKAGEWTDDTTMTLCLASSLVVKRDFDAQDQFERYRRWYKDGYLSSVGRCFDIGKATREAIQRFIEFEEREKKNSQRQAQNVNKPSEDKLYFGDKEAAGNGSLMRVAPIPLFFYKEPIEAVLKYTEEATRMTHGDIRAIQATQYFAYLIHQAVHGMPKSHLLNGKKFLDEFGSQWHPEVKEVVLGSYTKKPQGYEDGIRGKGFVVQALEAALWAFHTDGNSFDRGVLNAINLGDDTDTTAAIYGQLAGAHYGIDKISKDWRKKLFQCRFIETMATELFNRSINGANLQHSDW